MKDEILRAIEYFTIEPKDRKWLNEKYTANIDTALRALQEQLERLEDKPLTLIELKDMVGMPVYVSDGSQGAWALIESVDLETSHIDYHIGTLIDLSFEVYFYKNKPRE